MQGRCMTTKSDRSRELHWETYGRWCVAAVGIGRVVSVKQKNLCMKIVKSE